MIKEETAQLSIVVDIIEFSLFATETLTKNKMFWEEHKAYAFLQMLHSI
jgi:hypothetical protein